MRTSQTGRLLLLIEVADTLVERDLEAKLPLYMRVASPERGSSTCQ